MPSLKAEIEQRHGSTHRFCKLHPELNRATVYMVLAGTYGGNVPRQEKRIRQALEGGGGESLIYAAIKRIACGRCNVSGHCNRCDSLFRAQAAAVMEVMD